MYWHQALAEDAAILLCRRELLQLVGLIAMSGCRGEAPPRKATPASTKPTKPIATLPWSPAVHASLAAACDTILPLGAASAVGFPGATQAGVIDYIAKQLAQPPLARLAPALIVFAAALDEFARAQGSLSFAQATPSVRQAAVNALATGTLPIKLPQRPLFTVLRSLTLEGLLADPSHGGNRQGVGWTAIGLPATSQVHHHGDLSTGP
ncbi:MAG: gluconate 2-dehydrogenase subunit 3 family protein [Myxococcales bacterium]|nr:gluconate 2-dehydrogenase subunit 3 family protein [Myxococcales bacterium]